MLLDMLLLLEEAGESSGASAAAGGRGWASAINTKEILLSLWAAGELTDEELAELLAS